MMQEDTSPYWVRMSVEATCGTISALMVAPFVSIVDKAIVSNASGLQPLIPSIHEGLKSFICRPASFFRQPSFLLIWGVYSGTYITANTIDAACERANASPVVPKFAGSSAANVTLSVFEDMAFVRLFGTGPAKRLPITSSGLFAMRDCMTVLASFTMPGLVSHNLQNIGASKPFSDTSAQPITPCGMQLLSCPLHLLGLDKYNRPGASTADRLNFIKKEYIRTTIARMARIFPAFGIGGVVNMKLREEAKLRLSIEYASSAINASPEGAMILMR